MGYVVASDLWNRGFATEAAKASLQHGFDVAGLSTIISTTFADHRASRRVMEKCGMTFQGVIRWRDADIAWYALDKPPTSSGAETAFAYREKEASSREAAQDRMGGNAD